MRFFCTYFDQNYLLRGLALYDSLRRHCGSFRLWVLCMDRRSYDLLAQLGLEGLHPIALDDFEKMDHDLQRAKRDRSRIEYYFTCSPSLPLYVLEHNPQVDLITYLDADLYVYSDLTPVFTEIGEHSIAIIAHRFPPQLAGWERYGVYNVGWLSFKRDPSALSCLRWWRERCLEWCYDRCEDGRFADQKYLDDWPRRFSRVVVLSHKGANLAPWNLANHSIRAEGDTVWVDEDPLIFYHFHGLKRIGAFVYDPRLVGYQTRASSVVRRSIYGPYLRRLAILSRSLPCAASKGILRNSIRDVAHAPHISGWLSHEAARWRRLAEGIMNQEYIVMVHGHVF